jgi:hypothetical protein
MPQVNTTRARREDDTTIPNAGDGILGAVYLIPFQQLKEVRGAEK